MIITFKEFKNKVRNNATVCFGSFRFEEADERKGREVSLRRFGKNEQYCYGDASFFFNLPLADSYKMDVYTEYESSFGSNFVKEDAPVDFNADTFFVNVPNFFADIEKAYKRKNDYKHCCINNHVISFVSVACATWMRLTNYLKGKNEVEFLDGAIVIGECEQDEAKLTAKVRKYIGFAEKAFQKYLDKNGIANETEYMKMLARKEAEKKEAEKAEKKAEKARAKELAYIKDHICIFDGAGKNKKKLEISDIAYRFLNTGTHTYGNTGYISPCNGITCFESKDFDGYSKSCRYPMIRRSFTLYLKKGYYVYYVGGLITFVRGEIKRHGVACEWIEQGKAIADIETVKGFLVRGEHIVAKSLKEAQRISAEKRNKQALSLLNARSKDQLVYQKLGNHMFTFEESLASGNCRPGTQGFKNRYEAAIGHEATEISLADLRKYGKMFGLEEYTERVIRYVMNKL